MEWEQEVAIGEERKMHSLFRRGDLSARSKINDLRLRVPSMYSDADPRNVLLCIEDMET